MSGRLAVHQTAPGNPRIHLCQEYAMRTGGYDDKARVDTRSGPGDHQVQRGVPFARVVEVCNGDVDHAIRMVEVCAWQSASDSEAWRQRSDDPVLCADCIEVAHA